MATRLMSRRLSRVDSAIRASRFAFPARGLQWFVIEGKPLALLPPFARPGDILVPVEDYLLPETRMMLLIRPTREPSYDAIGRAYCILEDTTKYTSSMGSEVPRSQHVRMSIEIQASVRDFIALFSCELYPASDGTFDINDTLEQIQTNPFSSPSGAAITFEGDWLDMMDMA